MALRLSNFKKDICIVCKNEAHLSLLIRMAKKMGLTQFGSMRDGDLNLILNISAETYLTFGTTMRYETNDIYVSEQFL